MDNSDADTISDSRDEFIAPQDNAMAIDHPAEHSDNSNDSENEPMHNSDAGTISDSDNGSVPHHEIASESDNEAMSDSGDELMPDDNDDDNDDMHGYDPRFEAFRFNAELAQLDHPLGNFQASDRFILTVARTLRCKQSWLSMIESFKVDNVQFNQNFPTAMKDFWRMVNFRSDNFRYQVVCTVCWDQIGNGKKPTRICRCTRCGPRLKNDQLGTYLYIDLRSQIQGLLGKPGIARDLEYPTTRRKSHPDAMEDVYDGRHYRHHSAPGQFLAPGNHNYSLSVWADGVSVVETNTIQILPVLVHVLELSPRARQRNSVLCALYVGPRKPKMGQYLEPVAHELLDLHDNGVNWIRDGNMINSRFITLIVSADSEERYAIFGMTRHNGRFGCTFCYTDGERIEPRNPPIYRVRGDNAPDRTHEEIMHDARLLRRRRNEDRVREQGHGIIAERGVKRVSAMAIVPQFDLRIGQLVEGMHCEWEGNFVRLFNNLTNSEREFHITEVQLGFISSSIILIRTPTKLSRLPRDLKSFANFTATEYRNLCWYYWLPCAQQYLQPNQLRLCAKFAEATFIFNKDSIMPEELNRAQQLLQEYREDFEQLFPENQLVYNVHLLKHKHRSVRDLGPSWVASGFWFESLNRQIVNYLTSPTDRAWQVGSRMLLRQMIEKFLDRPLLNPEALQLLRELIGKERWENPPDNAAGKYTRYNNEGLEGMFARQEMAALIEAGFDNLHPHEILVRRHNSVFVDGVKYQTPTQTKHDNSLACVNAPHLGQGIHFIKITSIVTWQREGAREGFFGFQFEIIGPAFETTYMKIVRHTENLVYVPLESVVSPAVLVEVPCETYISRLPNRWDND